MLPADVASFHAVFFHAIVLLVASHVGPLAASAQKEPKRVELTEEQRKELLAERDRLWDAAQGFDEQGKLGEAIESGTRMLRIERRLFGNVDEDVFFSIIWLADCYEQREDFAQAQPLRKEAISIASNLFKEQPWKVTDARVGLRKLQQLAALTAEQRKQVRKAVQLNSQVVTNYHQGKYQQAINIAEQALRLQQLLLGSEDLDTATSLANLGALHESMRDYAKAEPLQKQALEIVKKVSGEEHANTATSLNNLAVLYQAMGDYANAEPLYKQALEIVRTMLGEEHPHTASSLNNLATLYESVGDYAKAEPLFRQSVAITLKHLRLTAVVQSQRQQLAMTNALRFHLDSYLSFAVTSDRYNESAYRQLLAWKGLVSSRQRALRTLGDRPKLRPTFEELKSVTQQLATLAFQTPTPERKKVWQEQIVKLSEQKEILEAKLSRNSQEYREAVKPVTLEDLRNALPDRCVLVDFLEYWHHTPSRKIKKENPHPSPLPEGERERWERRFAAFVIRKNRPARLIDIRDAGSLSEAIDIWRTGFGHTTESARAGQTLRERIWQPLEEELADAKIVLISPDGALGKLPFAALPGKEEGTYLIEERSIAMIPAPQDLPRLLRPTKPNELKGNVLLIGDVEYDSDQTDTASDSAVDFLSQFAVRGGEPLSFAPLPGTKGELATIRDTYENRFGKNGLSRLTGAEATESAFREQAPHHFFLHVATHGFFAP
ncbi:MAG: CHAT domain-containing protein, partial [Planctomycetes bacterium]|nr:CHAT domain-containing protein [Planctomycetota bacterium]